METPASTAAAAAAYVDFMMAGGSEQARWIGTFVLFCYGPSLVGRGEQQAPEMPEVQPKGISFEKRLNDKRSSACQGQRRAGPKSANVLLRSGCKCSL